MQKFASNVQDTLGNALASASVTVYTDAAHTITATIYSDNGITQTTNPLTTDSLGGFSFYAADGRYYLKVTKTGVTTEYMDDVLLFDPNASTGAAFVKYLPSGTRALARTVSSALGALVRSGDFDTTQHFNTALAALTETIGVSKLTFASKYSSTANFTFGNFDGGGTNSVFRWGYNLSSTLYTPNDLTEPQLFGGFETNFTGNSEFYIRFEGIGNTSVSEGRASGFVEPFFANFNRSTNFISTTAVRGENIVLQNTDLQSYMDMTASRLQIVPKTNVGSSENPTTTLHVHGATYGASFDGLTVGDTLGSSRVQIGYSSTSIASTKLVPAQLQWSGTSEASGELEIGARGDVACGISLYTAPDVNTTGLKLRMRISSQGLHTICASTATPSGGNANAALIFGTTSGFGIYYGSGVPTVSAAQGSLYLRSDGSSTSTRAYINNSSGSGTTWTAITTAA